MKTKVMTILVAGSFVFGTAGMAGAVMVSPQSVVDNPIGAINSNYTAQNMIDHSGLVTDFTSGVTELTSYDDGNTDTGHRVEPYTSFASPENKTKGAIDFDLGASYELTSFLLWNDKDYQGISDFQLTFSDDQFFSNSVTLGPFTASYGYDETGTEIPLQKFDFPNKVKGRYVRLIIWGIHEGDSFAQLAQIAEIAFDTAPAGVDKNDVDGCEIDQICPCGYDWTNHGEYVNCVVKASGDCVADSSMSEAGRGDIVSEAAHSTCGQKGPKNK